MEDWKTWFAKNKPPNKRQLPPAEVTPKEEPPKQPPVDGAVEETKESFLRKLCNVQKSEEPVVTDIEKMLGENPETPPKDAINKDKFIDEETGNIAEEWAELGKEVKGLWTPQQRIVMLTFMILRRLNGESFLKKDSTIGGDDYKKALKQALALAKFLIAKMRDQG